LASASDSTSYVIKEFSEIYGRPPEVVASAPGRLDFLNTHQDYKGLPVVSVAINKRTYIALAKSKSSSRVVSLNLCAEGVECTDVFQAGHVLLRGGKFFGDYIRSVVIALREEGYSIGDFDTLIYSEIPVASGLASSAALQVALITGLNELYSLGLTKKDIAELAYHSEHDIMGIPCGRLDQYGSVMGGVTRIETKPPYNTKTYTGLNWVFVVLYSGIKHSTAEVHPRRISEITRGLKQLLQDPSLPRVVRAKLSEKIDEVKWEELEISDLEPYLEKLDMASARRILFTIKMHKSTVLTLNLIEDPGSRTAKSALRDFLAAECASCLEPAARAGDELLELVSATVNYQHVLLRDLYEVSLPELELIRNTALSAGALGVKISGAGLGGSLLALASGSREAERVASLTLGAAKSTWVVEVDEGARVERVLGG